MTSVKESIQKNDAKPLAFKLGPNAPTNYALEGSVAIAGAAVQWLRDSLGIISSASEIEEMALQVESTVGDARGVCIGITRFTSKAHIARAVLESMCFQVKDVLDSMHKDSGESESQKKFLLRVDGGAAVNNLLMQIQADLVGCPIIRPADIETTALGAAYAAGLAIGIWKEDYVFNTEEKLKNANVFRPLMTEELRKKKVDSWCKAVSKTFDLADLAL
ncbi:Glycerol kinase [Glycine soja]